MRILSLILICLALTVPSSASPLVPAIANPGFEETAPGNDAPGWGWYNRATASFRSETQNPHSGARCLVFTNGSDLAPEVYGRLFQNVAVLPGIEYELSVWVRAEEVASAIHFTDWNSYTLNVPEGTYDWQQISTVFRTKNDQHSLNLGINVVNRCRALAIDDVSLRPIGSPLKGEGIEGSYLVPGQVEGDKRPAYLGILITSALEGAATVKATITAGKETIFHKSSPVNPGENTIEWEWDSGSAAVRQLDFLVRVLDGKGRVIASASQKVEKLSPAVIAGDIDRVEARLKEFNALYEKCRAKGIPLDYPTAARTMLAQFIPLTREDLQKNEEVRADYAVKDFARSLDRAIAEMRTYLKNPKLAPNARRYQTGKVDIAGVSFIGDRKDTKGRKSRGPVFFCGYGHFGQVRADIPRFPGYGVNIIQIEVGPSITMPSENEISLKAANDIVEVLDNAAKHNVMVNILLSPHYFPGWAMEKWPHLAKGGGGFLGYCVDAPEAKQVIEKFLRAVVPLFRGKPALHSFCLSNEPLFDRTAGCENTKPMWADYLARVHGDVQAMNDRYGTAYSSFADVPIPGNDAYTAPQFYDYCAFNQERFAAWHKWMADIIHEMAPEVPVHAKVMAWTFFMRNTIAWGTDAERFGGFSQINGNDCAMWPGGGGGWAISWHGQNMAYDLQRSVVRQPIFNSENHLTPDRSTYYVPPEHFRTALWQGAIHGQGATTIWVWERTYDKGSDFYGNVMQRPGCAEAVGRTCLDLNRFAEEVTALQNVRAPVAILYSISSIARNPRYLDAVGRAYSALNFCGAKIDFISEKQLAAGSGKDYRMIVLPDATHLPAATFEALCSLPETTRLVILGDAPQKDPYGRDFAADKVSGITARAGAFPADADSEKMWTRLQFELAFLGALPDILVLGAATENPVWGVEWLPAKVNGRTVVNLINLRDAPVEVQIFSRGDPVSARNLLGLGGDQKVLKLMPMVPVLAEVAK